MSSTDDVTAYCGAPLVPVFHPSMEEMSDFNAYMKSIECQCDAGLCKVVPPPEYVACSSYTEKLEKDFVVRLPIEQCAEGVKGVYVATYFTRNGTSYKVTFL